MRRCSTWYCYSTLRHGSIGVSVVCFPRQILARRGLKRYITSLAMGFHTGHPTAVALLERGGSGRLRFRPGVELHFYTSSAPCGNATVKKWAKGSQPKYREDLTLILTLTLTLTLLGGPWPRVLPIGGPPSLPPHSPNGRPSAALGQKAAKRAGKP